MLPRVDVRENADSDARQVMDRFPEEIPEILRLCGVERVRGENGAF